MAVAAIFKNPKIEISWQRFDLSDQGHSPGPPNTFSPKPVWIKPWYRTTPVVASLTTTTTSDKHDPRLKSLSVYQASSMLGCAQAM